MKNENVIKVSIVFIIIIIGLAILVLNNKKNNNKVEKFNTGSEYTNYVDDYLNQLENNLKKSNTKFESEKSKNKNVDSILIKIENEDEDVKFYTYMTYNIDHDNKTILNNKEVANEFGYSLDDIVKKVNERFNKLYKEEINKKYVDKNECDLECYKSFYRGVDDIYSSFSLYVKKDKLYIYLTFKVDSLSGDSEFFKKLKYNPYKIEM